MTRKCEMKSGQGFTLMELLVVLLIIGILSTVALRTIDATRNRSLFDQTTREMNQLVQAMVGNPDMTYDGRRVDFGFYGDMERLPNDLRELVSDPGDPSWHGPYMRRTVAGDTAGYLLDGWGNYYTYNPSMGTISSGGTGKNTLTMRVADTLTHLDSNIICGTITDADGNPPGTRAMSPIVVWLYYNNEVLNPPRLTVPDPSGYYEYSPTSPDGPDLVPIGIHKLQAVCMGETLTRWVTVAPRSRTVVDFKLAQSFYNRLRVVGPPRLWASDSSGFAIDIVNTGMIDITTSELWCFETNPDDAWMRTFLIDGNLGDGYPIPNGLPATGPGDTVRYAPVTISPNMSEKVELLFQDFYETENGLGQRANVYNKVFQYRFDDGSEITVRPVNP
jgi:prepilin-type N-terminal cleavage/methylation domain-containing protein